MTTGSVWEENELERKVVEVLSGVTCDSSHHFGRPFLTAYQLAILVKDRFPDTFSLLGYPLGGRGAGVRYSFTSYLARQLSQKIKDRAITNIEGRFLSNVQLLDIEFNDDGESVVSSLTDSQDDLSMFRYIG